MELAVLNKSELNNFFETLNVRIDKLMEAMQSAPIKESRLITQKELAKYLSVTEQTIIKWKAKGKIPYLQFGDVIRYDLNEVNRALEVPCKKKGTYNA